MTDVLTADRHQWIRQVALDVSCCNKGGGCRSVGEAIGRGALGTFTVIDVQVHYRAAMAKGPNTKVVNKDNPLLWEMHNSGFQHTFHLKMR